MIKMRKALLAILAAGLVLSNLNIAVFAEEQKDPMDLTAGAATIMESAVEDDLDTVNAGAEKAEDIAAAHAIINPVSMNNLAYGATSLSENDPLYELFGRRLVMSNVTDSVNVRVEPDEESDIAGKLYHCCAASSIIQKDGWTKIKSGDLIGWVRNDYLLFDKEAVVMARQAGGLVATVETDCLRIREDTDTNSAVYGLLGKGDKIDVIEQTDGWIKVAYSDNTEGYISGDFVDLAYEIDLGETIESIKAREEREAAAAKAKKEKEAAIKASRTTSTTTTNNGKVSAEVSDVTLLAALIQAECGNEIYPGKLAVGAVVVNRARGRYGSISNAVFAPGQFGPAASGKVAAIVNMGPNAECIKAAQEAIGGTSNVGSATHFRNIRSGYAGVVIGNHVFW